MIRTVMEPLVEAGSIRCCGAARSSPMRFGEDRARQVHRGGVAHGDAGGREFGLNTSATMMFGHIEGR